VFLHSPPASSADWDQVASKPRPSWYLDRLVARQKRQVHQELVRRWAGAGFSGAVLKTDLFEEAHGEDQILFDLYPDALTLGIDVSWQTAKNARRRSSHPRAHFAGADVRHLALREASVDLVVSTSTLDHFDTKEELRQALAEIARVLRPGGVAVITLDNAQNPLYWLLRWASRRGWAPYRLGETARLAELVDLLQDAGMRVDATDWLLHNPRVISTSVFLLLRRVLGRHADVPIRGLLTVFSWLAKLPTRRYTACFVAARGEKAAADPSLSARRG